MSPSTYACLFSGVVRRTNTESPAVNVRPYGSRARLPPLGGLGRLRVFLLGGVGTGGVGGSVLLALDGDSGSARLSLDRRVLSEDTVVTDASIAVTDAPRGTSFFGRLDPCLEPGVVGCLGAVAGDAVVGGVFGGNSASPTGHLAGSSPGPGCRQVFVEGWFNPLPRELPRESDSRMTDEFPK